MAGAYFSSTVLSKSSSPPSRLNRLSSSDMKLRAIVLQREVSLRQAGAMLAPGELTIEGGCLASSLGLRRPWGPTVQGTRKSSCPGEVRAVQNARCKIQDAGGVGRLGEGQVYNYGLVQDSTIRGKWLSGSTMFHARQPDLGGERGSIIWLAWNSDARTIAMSGKGDAYAPPD